jgi:hypothetical protein
VQPRCKVGGSVPPPPRELASPMQDGRLRPPTLASIHRGAAPAGESSAVGSRRRPAESSP